MYLKEDAVKHIKDVIIQFLRLYFNNPKNYRKKLPPQISDTAFIDIAFYDTDPEELRSFPTVIITATSGNMITAGLGDLAREVRDPRTGSVVAYRYEGFYEMGVTIDIGCKNPLEREVLTDFIAKAIRFSLRRYMQNNGVLVKNVSYSGESTYDYNSDKIYVSQLRVDTWSVWIEDVDLLDPDEFNVQVTMSSDGGNTENIVSNGDEYDVDNSGHSNNWAKELTE